MQVCTFQHMNCLHPIMMYDTGKATATGKRSLSAKANPRLPFEQVCIPVPCGHCEACLLNRQREWISRLRLEHFVSDSSCFFTLTYAKNPYKFFKAHVQNFIKRIRNVGRDFGFPISHLRYIVTGERGSKYGRPHWHGIFYGIDFLSSEWNPYIALFKDGFPVYSSKLLERIWNRGFVSFDKVTTRSIKYVAKYILKDGSVSLKSQGLGRSPFVRCSRHGRKTSYSLRPLFYQSLDNGFVVVPSDTYSFSPIGIPKAFDRYLERCDSSLFDSVRKRRADFVKNRAFGDYGIGECAMIASFNYSQNQKKGIIDNES